MKMKQANLALPLGGTLALIVVVVAGLTGSADEQAKRLLMFMRTTLGRIYATISKDGGENWHMPQPTALAMSYSPCRLQGRGSPYRFSASRSR